MLLLGDVLYLIVEGGLMFEVFGSCERVFDLGCERDVGT
jgi:hypothetical protein